MNFYNTQQIRQWDEFTIQNEPIASYDLMERAATEACSAILKIIKPNDKVMIICGNGNNGGDGFVIAHLLLKAGFDVSVLHFDAPDWFSKDTLYHYQKLILSNPTNVWQSNDNFKDFSIAEYDVMIDALFGSGLNRPLEGKWLKMIESINTHSNLLKIAIDVPSGFPTEIDIAKIDNYKNKYLKCQYTMTFQLLKPSFLYVESEEATGKVEIIDIGLMDSFSKSMKSDHYFLNFDEVKYALPQRTKFGHKGTYGHGLIIGGSQGKYGAMVLSAKSMMKTGAGMGTVLCTKGSELVIPIAIPEVMSLVNSGTNFLEFQHIDFTPFDAIGIGPGLGQEASTQELLLDVIENCYQLNLPMVIDADGLNMIAKIGMAKILWPTKTILTPHPKEFERLANKTFRHTKERADYAQELAMKHQITILLKGGISAVFHPDGQVCYQLESSVALATAGSGDTLTGIITSLLTQGLNTKQAASIGMFIHAWAGVWCSKNLGSASTTASDISKGIEAFYKQIEKT
jgi:hydroxyethylthiazole kinase-like uncharacterized protein yjeF